MISTDAELIGPWVADRIGFKWTTGRSQAIGRVKNGEVVAGVLYEDYNTVNVVCHIACDPNGINRQFLSIIFDYPFRQLKCQRITAVVAESNEKSRNLVEHMGFEVEANLLHAHPDGDLIVYRMMADDCRWTKEFLYGQSKRTSGARLRSRCTSNGSGEPRRSTTSNASKQAKPIHAVGIVNMVK